MVSLLAVLKAGAAHLPVESGDPPVRVSLMLKEAQVSIVLVDRHAQASVAASELWEMVSVMPGERRDAGCKSEVVIGALARINFAATRLNLSVSLTVS